ncbi:AMP-binding protein [Sinorhizobium sp. 8-89]|uniref:class I adenylate-forming enzyme family protein n=1 Tax=Sinorhizobium sp. 7-81 TaxID=3049087 RepID=UPI0024C3412A|nr:AMP-binding protein [Sinorhizobium sp. 7-81]MDK1390134.1 AMP-binding protein [Sinorhizobium sp. 7-81]
MSQIAHLGEVLGTYARVFPDKIGARDLDRELTYRAWNDRACRLANALVGMGLAKGDRVCVLAYNCLEWVEIYAATAKAGLIAVPINFRLVGPEILYLIEDCQARVLIVQDELIGSIEPVRADLPLPASNFVIFGEHTRIAGYRAYEDLIAAASDSATSINISTDDPSTLMYTSGTTGKPKGAVRNHGSSAIMALVADVELTLTARDTALLAMPMCHANSLFLLGAFAYCGAACTIYSRKKFDPEHLVHTLAQGGATFTSLVPTHYIMMLGLPSAVRRRYNLDAVTKLMISSAPAHRDTKLAIMDYFRNAGLYELYGSTEAGMVTILHPDEQLSNLGSVGRECIGSRRIKLLDPLGNEVPDGEAGELYSCNPYTFDGYWNLPEKTREAFRGDYCTVGDLARRDEDGYIYLIDRKSNMIISGGENVYPAEVEGVLGGHPKVKHVAVMAVPDEKWGERVHAVIVLQDGQAPTPDEILDWCKSRIAGHKRPRSISFIREDEMPMTATGKILHRLLHTRNPAGSCYR